MAETFRDDRQQKAIETDLLLLSMQNKRAYFATKNISQMEKYWMNCNVFILQRISMKCDYMEMLSSKVSPQQHTVLHLITYRISFR